MKKIYLVFCLFALTALMASCHKNNTLNKSIFDELTAEEIEAAVAADSAFAATYDIISHFNSDIFHNPEGMPGPLTDEEIEKYRAITYAQFHAFHQYLSDTSIWGPLHRTWSEEWQQQSPKFDSAFASIENQYQTIFNGQSNNDKVIKVNSIDTLPIDIADYFIHRDSDNDPAVLEYYKSLIIKHYIDSTYIDRHSYIDAKQMEKMGKKDALVNEFINTMRIKEHHNNSPNDHPCPQQNL